MIKIKKSKTAGRYWDEGIKIVSGCTRCSPGCDHCWSLAMDKRFSPAVNENLIITHPERLKRFNTRKPKVFSIWNDLLHKNVDRNFIETALTAMYYQPFNTFLILTKRPERLVEISRLGHWPYENVYLGLTVCNQQEADEKIPIFLQVPGKKFLSIEPMLGPVIIRKYIEDDCDCGICKLCNGQIKDRRLIDAVILGGESGPKARPLHPDWVRSVRDQCAAAGVPFFFKQWGSSGVMGSAFKGNEWHDAGYDFKIKQTHGRLLDGRTHDELPWVKP